MHSTPLLEALDRRAEENLFASVALLVSTDASLSKDYRDGLLHHQPTMFMIDSLGSSEASGFALSTPESGVFKPMPTTTVLDDQMQEVTPVSDPIGIAYSGGYIPLGYYNQPEKSAETFVVHEDTRYVKTGDRCTVREDGMLMLLGRDCTVINTGGEKVYTVEVERALLSFPAIEAVQAHTRDQLADYKVPRKVYAIDSLQRADNGKPDYTFVTGYAQAQLDEESGA